MVCLEENILSRFSVFGGGEQRLAKLIEMVFKYSTRTAKKTQRLHNYKDQLVNAV
jgi:hypothetical protein